MTIFLYILYVYTHPTPPHPTPPYARTRNQMLGNIIKQITQERHDDKSISTQLGTNQIHTLSNMKGFRKVGRNMLFGLFAPPAAVVDIDARDLINKRMAVINAPAPHVTEEAPAPHVTEEAPATESSNPPLGEITPIEIESTLSE